MFSWFSSVFTYKGDNHALQGFYDAIVLVMETGFAVTAFLAMILNLSIGEEIEQDAPQLDGRVVQQEDEISRAESQTTELESEKAKSAPKVGEVSV